MKRTTSFSAAAVLATGAAVAASVSNGPTAGADEIPARADAVASFGEIARVLQSPRCQNCHPSDDRPRRGDHGLVHAMNVSRRSPEAGLACTACHRETNAKMPHGPPGAHGWNLPPKATPMVFQGRAVGDLCRQLVAPATNGQRSLADLRAHLDHDPLVLWGWAPGPGRTLPPLAHADLMVHVDRWVAAGGPCPD